MVYFIKIIKKIITNISDSLLKAPSDSAFSAVMVSKVIRLTAI